ncbi:hypothetical protein [uncultured Desulfosarcina sp.]|uniref:hypothetical protein n=1 Tax=uncultured Desulfosarcina sp. TaxID=218289 RepID=UPI0029C8AB63|nr:hypothetical protein [uncultured Desulfosarcina sp.]
MNRRSPGCLTTESSLRLPEGGVIDMKRVSGIAIRTAVQAGKPGRQTSYTRQAITSCRLEPDETISGVATSGSDRTTRHRLDAIGKKRASAPISVADAVSQQGSF